MSGNVPPLTAEERRVLLAIAELDPPVALVVGQAGAPASAPDDVVTVGIAVAGDLAAANLVAIQRRPAGFVAILTEDGKAAVELELAP